MQGILMKAKASFRADAGMVRRGTEFVAVHEPRAREFERLGIAERIVPQPEALEIPPSTNALEATAPLSAAPAGVLGGSQTGADSPPSSSPPARRPRKRRSKGSGARLV